MQKHDMSAGIVRLDLETLVAVAGHAVRNAKSAMDRCQSEIDSTIHQRLSKDRTEIYHANHHAQFYGHELAEAAQVYAEALEAYFVLVECRRREQIIVIRDESLIEQYN